jgi:CheY-like chemotaxis protein
MKMNVENAGRARALKILVVDDNRDGAESLAALLQLSGHEVRLAYDGEKALAIAREFVPDVAFIDLGLPLMDGFQVARLMRKERALKTAVLVALTGYGHDEDKRQCMEAGFDHHLVKPADLDALERLLQNVPGAGQPNNGGMRH